LRNGTDDQNNAVESQQRQQPAIKVFLIDPVLRFDAGIKTD